MQQRDWQSPARCAIGLLLAGDALDWRDDRGEPVIDDSFLVLLNGGREDTAFVLPGAEWGRRWAKRIDTRESALCRGTELDAGATVTLVRNSAMVLERVVPTRGSWRVARAAEEG
jgi:glycogen operon protein